MGRLLELGHFGIRNMVEQPLDHVVGGQSFCLGLKVGADAMPQDGHGNLSHVWDAHGKVTVHGGQCLAAVDQELAGPRAGPPIDEISRRSPEPIRPWAEWRGPDSARI